MASDPQDEDGEEVGWDVLIDWWAGEIERRERVRNEAEAKRRRPYLLDSCN